MKVLIPVKRVLDYNVKARVKADQSGVDLANVKMSMNPFDEIAVEEAVRLQEAGTATETIVVSIGPEKAQSEIRTALAMGVDRGVHVKTDDDLEPLAIAKLLAKIAQEQGADLVIMGKQAIDNDNNQTGQMLAALWGRPQATFASEVTLDGDKATVTREVDVGLETIEIDLPAVITADLRLNEPRYVKLPDIMKAKKKPLDEIPVADLGVSASAGLTNVSFEPPAQRQKGIMVEDVAGLVQALKDKGLA